MTPWNRNLFGIEDSTASVFSVVRDYPGGVRFKFEVKSTGSEQVSVLDNDFIVRMLCHALIERLPDNALDETWRSIYDNLEWYSRPKLPLSEPEHSPFILPRICEPVEQEPFTLTEE